MKRALGRNTGPACHSPTVSSTSRWRDTRCCTAACACHLGRCRYRTFLCTCPTATPAQDVDSRDPVPGCVVHPAAAHRSALPEVQCQVLPFGHTQEHEQGLLALSHSCQARLASPSSERPSRQLVRGLRSFWPSTCSKSPITRTVIGAVYWC